MDPDNTDAYRSFVYKQDQLTTMFQSIAFF